MKRLTLWLAAKAAPKDRDPAHIAYRARIAGLEAWTSIIVNTLLFIIKLALALTLNSIALLVDAIHTLSDSATSILILYGYRVAKKPADKEHPFGHGRMEAIMTLVLAILLIITGVEFLRNSIARIITPEVSPEKFSLTIALVIFITIVLKDALARFALHLGELIDSKMLHADFWHHRSDAISSVLVLVALAAGRWGYPNLDGVAGALVSLILFYSGFTIARDAISPLLGEAPSKTLLEKIEKITRSVNGVHGIHDVIIHGYGQMHLVSLHIEVEDNQSVAQAHKLADQVELYIKRDCGIAAVVHVDPVSHDHAQAQTIRRLIREQIETDPRILLFHDLQIEQQEGRLKLQFEIDLDEQIDPQQAQHLRHNLQKQLTQKLDHTDVQVRIGPKYAYSPQINPNQTNE